MKRIPIILCLFLALACTRKTEVPAILFGGEMHNSNASTPESIDASMDIAKVAFFMECSEKTARKVLAEAGPLISATKDGKKLIWHINLNTLSSEPT